MGADYPGVVTALIVKRMQDVFWEKSKEHPVCGTIDRKRILT